MHIFFSGIGGTAIGPLAIIAKQAGYTVSGSDKQESQYIDYLRKHDISDIHIGQDRDQIETRHNTKPIDWFVYSSAVAMENPNAPELLFCHEQNIKISKRDELLNQIISDKNLKLIAVAGTHGKTTTTAMVIWLFKQLNVPLSYSVGAKIPFGDMGHYEKDSKYFVYEADEFDRNFLAFEPHLSLITGVTWDHHEIFPTREDYQQAFREFMEQSDHNYVWRDDADYLELGGATNISVIEPNDTLHVKLPGLYNRLDAQLVIESIGREVGTPPPQLIEIINHFPGLQRRMEQIVPNLFSDYAHTPEKVRGAMSVASEMAAETGQNLIVVYEPLTNRRQHFMIDDYKDCFDGASHVYWTPSYLAREDPSQRIIPPEELISHLSDPGIASPAALDGTLKASIERHLSDGDMVVGMAGGGGGSLDEWLRKEFTT